MIHYGVVGDAGTIELDAPMIALDMLRSNCCLRVGLEKVSDL